MLSYFKNVDFTSLHFILITYLINIPKNVTGHPAQLLTQELRNAAFEQADRHGFRLKQQNQETVTEHFAQGNKTSDLTRKRADAHWGMCHSLKQLPHNEKVMFNYVQSKSWSIHTKLTKVQSLSYGKI